MTCVLDYAECPRCGHSTPIQPSTFSSVGEHRKWTKTDTVTEFFLCSVCNRAAAIPEQGLKPLPSSEGLFPYHEDAPIRVFEVPIECDELNCKAQATLFVVRSRETSDAAVREESEKWILDDMRCPAGHRLSWPPWH